MLFTTVATAFFTLASSTTALVVVWKPAYSWQVANLDAGCRDGQCNYKFDISSMEHNDIPEFTAQCSAQTQRRDNTYRECRLVEDEQQRKGKRQSGRRVEKVEAFLSLTPVVPQDTEFSVKVTVNDGTNIRTWWYGTKTDEPYGFYDTTTEFDVVPEIGGSIAD